MFFNFQGGMIRNRYFVTKDVRAKKFYKREGGLVKDDTFGMGDNLGNLTVIPTDDDYPFSEENDDDFDLFKPMEDDDFFGEDS